MYRKQSLIPNKNELKTACDELHNTHIKCKKISTTYFLFYKISQKLLFLIALGSSAYSQENFTTIVYAELGGQTK